MYKKCTRELKYDTDYLKIENEALNDRISLELNKHNWLLHKLRDQALKNKPRVVGRCKSQSFECKKATKKSSRVKTGPMNFYKEQESTAMNKTNYREVTNPNKASPVNPSYPNIRVSQSTNKQNVRRDLNQNKRNVTDSQINKTRYKRDDISIFPLCDPPKPIKHNLPIAIQPDKKTYVAYKPNTSKSTLSSTNIQTGDSKSSDNIFKVPERPIPSTYYRTVLSGENARPESIRKPEMARNDPNKIFTERNAPQNDKPINLSNDNTKLLHQIKSATVDTDEKFEELMKKYEETLKNFLALTKIHKDLIIETHMSTINKIFNVEQEITEKKSFKILKLAKFISEILVSISDAVTTALQLLIYNNKSTQIVTQNKKETESLYASSTVLGNVATKPNASSNVPIDRNNDYDHLDQANVQVYHNQRLPMQTNAPVGKTNVINRENKTLKDFRPRYDTVPTVNQNPYLNTTQNVVTDTSAHPTLQSGNMNLQRNYQQNYNTMDNVQRERVQFEQYGNTNSPNVEQRYEHSVIPELSKTKVNDRTNRDNMPHKIGKQFGDTDEQDKREYLRHQMTNETESQKRKNLYTRDDPRLCSGNSKFIKYNTTAVPELAKRQRYEDMSDNVTFINEKLNAHKKSTDVIQPEDISNDILEVIDIPKKNEASLEGDTDKVTAECYNLDDDEDKCLTINEDPIAALFAISERNKSILMKNYMSQMSQVDKLTEKYAEDDVSDLQNYINIIKLVFNNIIDELGKICIANKFQLETMFNKHTQSETESELENINDKLTSHIIDINTVQNPVDNLAYNENEEVNISHVQHPREMYDQQANYEMVQQYCNPSNRNLLNPNQGQVRQHKTVSNVFNAPFMNQMDPRSQRPQRPQMIEDPRFNRPQRPQMIEDPRFNRPQRPQMVEDPRFNQLQRPQIIEDPRFNRQQRPQMVEDPRFNRQQMTVPMEQHTYISPPNAQSLSLPVQQRPFQYVNMNEHWNFDNNNRYRMNIDPTQMDHVQQYEAQMMMHQQNIEQQRYYYQMELQRKAWASQMGNYQRNDWN